MCFVLFIVLMDPSVKKNICGMLFVIHIQVDFGQLCMFKLVFITPIRG